MFQIHVFGKPGCSHCAALKKNLAEVIEEFPQEPIELVYEDLSTEDALFNLCKAQVINPARIPAVMCYTKDDTGLHQLENQDGYEKTGMISIPGGATCGYMGIQTDYSTGGNISKDTCRALVYSMITGNVFHPTDTQEAVTEDGYCEECHM